MAVYAQRAPANGHPCASLRGHACVVTIYALPRSVFAPKGGVAFRLRGVDGAAAPKAAIDEHGEVVGAEERDDAQLGGGVAVRADGRHHRGAFSAGENVDRNRARMPISVPAKGVDLRGDSPLQGLGVDAVFAAPGGEFVFDQIDQGNERN